MNNDGNDCFGLTTDHKNIHEEFLRTRTSPLAGSQVDAGSMSAPVPLSSPFAV